MQLKVKTCLPLTVPLQELKAINQELETGNSLLWTGPAQGLSGEHLSFGGDASYSIFPGVAFKRTLIHSPFQRMHAIRPQDVCSECGVETAVCMSAAVMTLLTSASTGRTHTNEYTCGGTLKSNICCTFVGATRFFFTLTMELVQLNLRMCYRLHLHSSLSVRVCLSSPPGFDFSNMCGSVQQLKCLSVPPGFEYTNLKDSLASFNAFNYTRVYAGIFQFNLITFKTFLKPHRHFSF